VQLPVQVAGADIVVIYDRQMTDARSRQRLDRPRSDAADADDAEAQPGQLRGGIATEHAGKTGGGIDVERGRIVIWHVYILRCADGSLYTGITTDPARRLREHNAGLRGATYTRSRRPVTLVYRQTATDRSQASRDEARIKRLPRDAKLKLVDLSGLPCNSSHEPDTTCHSRVDSREGQASGQRRS